MAKGFKKAISTARISKMVELLQDTKPSVSNSEELVESFNEESPSLAYIEIQQLQANPFQPRLQFSNENLEELMESIQQQGILQPMIGRPNPDGTTTIIAGHRRWFAAQKAGLTTVPVMLRKVSNDELHILALIENIQREDLHAIDKAVAFCDLAKKCQTQEEAAKLIGMKRTAFHTWLSIRTLSQPVIDTCRQISDFSLRDLTRISRLAASRQLFEARRLLSSRTQPQETDLKPPKEPSTSEKKPVNSRVFEYKHPKNRFICRVEIKASSKKHVLTLEEMREFLANALASIETEMSTR